MPSISDLRRRDDDARARFLRCIADDVATRIAAAGLTEGEARELADRVRFQASLLFPDRMDTYDRIYGARFARLIAQFLGTAGRV